MTLRLTARPGLGSSPVRTRVTSAAVAVGLVAAVLGGVAFVISLHSGAERALVASSAQRADAVVAQLDKGVPPSRAVLSGVHDVTTQILDHGEVVASDRPAVTTPIRVAPGTSRNVDVPGTSDHFIVVARASADGHLVVAGSSTEHIDSAVSTAIWLLAVATPIGIGLLALVVWVSVGRALRPVEAMRREAGEITSERLDRRLPVPDGEDELSRLARTLNEMLDRVDLVHRRQRQFVSDASHELRSPLAVLRQLAEVAARRPGQADAAELAADVLAEEHRMEDLVEALLTLARLDDDSLGPLEPVDLDEVVLAEVARLRTPGRVRLVVTSLTPVTVQGSAPLTGQAVRNLLSNALRHAVTTVEVRMVVVDDRVEIVIDDDGAGIPVAERERVFERFVRLDEARARESGGSGLGLAIVRKAVLALGGEVRIEDSPLGGARLVLDLPAEARA